MVYDHPCGAMIVFGTVHSTIVPTKTISGKILSKSSSGVVLKPSKSPKKTQSLTDSIENLANESAKKATIEVNRSKPRKKVFVFKKHRVGVAAAEPKTPVKSPVVVKPRLSGSITPFHSAEKCNKCRFDRLETSSYWLSQIKLVETIGKHTTTTTNNNNNPV
ncbi:hypothetical protein BC332_24853 [Capsicum chinense]|nr:hypothetical protein BC332_24853 [Capsicum chinense]